MLHLVLDSAPEIQRWFRHVNIHVSTCAAAEVVQTFPEANYYRQLANQASMVVA